MKIYIVGTVGSGKSTLSEKWSSLLNIPVFHLDEVVHQKNMKEKIGNTRRSEQEIRTDFQNILEQKHFIIEDCLRDQFASALTKVDYIVFLDPHKRIVKYRIVKRFFKQMLGLEKANYRPGLKMLRQMFVWVKESPREKIQNYPQLNILKNKKEIQLLTNKLIEERQKKND